MSSNTKDAEIIESRAMVPYSAVRPADITTVMESLKVVRTFVAEQLRDGLDYGVIPGTGGKQGVADKKTLLLPGAQKVTMLFNCYPHHRVERREMDEGHVEFVVTTEIISRGSGEIIGSGIGSCSTMEGKYRFRNAARTCPACGKGTIIKGKEEFGGGWLCWKKKDGCGATFKDGDKAIEGQQSGKIANENIHDTRNTVLKMAKKRAWVDAALGLGCLAELFTQDIEDTYDLTPEHEPAHHNDTLDVHPARPTKTLPANGNELKACLEATDKTVASEQGLCLIGDLMKHVLEEGVKLGFPSDFTQWAGPAIEFAAVETKAFIERLKQKKNGKPAVKPPPTNGAELKDRLNEFERKCVGDGLCRAGVLVAHVIGVVDVARPDLKGKPIKDWPADVVGIATEAAKAFRKQAVKERDEAEVPGADEISELKQSLEDIGESWEDVAKHMNLIGVSLEALTLVQWKAAMAHIAECVDAAATMQ